METLLYMAWREHVGYHEHLFSRDFSYCKPMDGNNVLVYSTLGALDCILSCICSISCTTMGCMACFIAIMPLANSHQRRVQRQPTDGCPMTRLDLMRPYRQYPTLRSKLCSRHYKRNRPVCTESGASSYRTVGRPLSPEPASLSPWLVP